MTLRECYDALGGSYDEVLGRLRSERLVQKFVLKFLADGSYGGTIASAAALFAQVQADYERTSSAIQAFQAGLG